MSFHGIIVSFFVGGFFHPQNMFLFHVLGLSFEGVRDSLLLHICFFCVWCLAHNLLSVQLVSCACILWIRCLLCKSSSFFGVSACVVFLLWVLVCFLWILVVILRLSFLDCSVLMLFLLLRVLPARLCVWVGFWAAFWRELSGGGRMDMAKGGVNMFFGFSHNRGVWVKTAAALGEECFFKVDIFQKPASKRWKRTPVFNFVAGNAIKLGVSEKIEKHKWSTTIYVFDFLVIFSDSKLYNCTLLGGLQDRAA